MVTDVRPSVLHHLRIHPLPFFHLCAKLAAVLIFCMACAAMLASWCFIHIMCCVSIKANHNCMYFLSLEGKAVGAVSVCQRLFAISFLAWDGLDIFCINFESLQPLCLALCQLFFLLLYGSCMCLTFKHLLGSSYLCFSFEIPRTVTGCDSLGTVC